MQDEIRFQVKVIGLLCIMKNEKGHAVVLLTDCDYGNKCVLYGLGTVGELVQWSSSDNKDRWRHMHAETNSKTQDTDPGSGHGGKRSIELSARKHDCITSNYSTQKK